MYDLDLWVAKMIVNRPLEKVLCLTEPSGPSRQTDAGQLGWLSQQGRRLLTQIGQYLVVLGERLKHYGLPQPSC